MLRRVEDIANGEATQLKDLIISECDEMEELFIGSSGFPMIETLKLNKLPNLNSVPYTM